MDPVPVFFPEFSRLSALAGDLMLLENDAAFAQLMQEMLGYLAAQRLGLGDGPAISPEMVSVGILHIGYIAGIEAYEREHQVEPKEEV